MLALILQQSMAAQERADRLMAVLIDRLAQQHAVPPPPPPMDPVAMMAGLAKVLEKLRPGQAGDSLAQLSGLVGVMKQLSGSQPAESPADELLGAMTSMLKTTPLYAAMTPPALPQGQQGAGPAMGRGAGGPPAAEAPPAPPPPQADPEVLSALSPEAIDAIRHMTTQKAHP